MGGSRLCGGPCGKPIVGRVYIHIPTYNAMCIDCAEPIMESVVSKAKGSATSVGAIKIAVRDLVSCIVHKYDEEKAARKNTPTAASIKRALNMGVLTVEDLEDLLDLAKENHDS